MRREFYINIKNALFITIPIILSSWFFTLLMAFAEKDVHNYFNDLPSLAWWWIVTVSTVGYGDIFPVTPMGRVFGGIVILSSLLFFGIVVSEFTSIFKLLYKLQESGLVNIRYKNHIVILNHNSLSDSIIAEFKKHLPHKKIVIISNFLETNPVKGVSFVKGDPKDLYILRQANLQFATHCLILLDENLYHPDAYNLVLAAEVEKVNSDVKTIVEISDSKNKHLFESVGVDVEITERKLLKEIVINENIDKLLKTFQIER